MYWPSGQLKSSLFGQRLLFVEILKSCAVDSKVGIRFVNGLGSFWILYYRERAEMTKVLLNRAPECIGFACSLRRRSFVITNVDFAEVVLIATCDLKTNDICQCGAPIVSHVDCSCSHFLIKWNSFLLCDEAWRWSLISITENKQQFDIV